MQIVTLNPGDVATVQGVATMLASTSPGRDNVIRVEVYEEPVSHGAITPFGRWYLLAESRDGQRKHAEVNSARGKQLRVIGTGGCVRVKAPVVECAHGV